MRILCGVLSAQVSGTGSRVEPLRGSSGALHRTRLHRMWNLFLLLPRAGRDYGLPHKSKGQDIRSGTGRRICGSSVKEM